MRPPDALEASIAAKLDCSEFNFSNASYSQVNPASILGRDMRTLKDLVAIFLIDLQNKIVERLVRNLGSSQVIDSGFLIGEPRLTATAGWSASHTRDNWRQKWKNL